jgi:signal transduction histidine kinase
MHVPLRVLIVEDSESDAALEVRALEAVGYRVSHTVVETADEMRTALAGRAFDIVFADVNMPQFDALAALAILKEGGQDIPFVIVSGSIGEETAVEMMKAGANDYVLKDKLSRLAFIVEHALQDAEDRRKLAQAEETLRQSQQHQLQVRDQFLSRMSHELRSPLTPIHQFVTILLDGLAGDLDAEQREYLAIVLRNVNALRTMVSDLLDVTRAESGRLNIDLRCVYLADLIPQTLEAFQMANTKELLVSSDVSDDLPPVLADPDRVRQILDNLLDNAVKFTPEKGAVKIVARLSDDNPELLCVRVTDTGSGIAKSDHEKIFEYSYQVEDGSYREHRGLGIGLHICRELVSSQGGRIWVESRPRRGSTFSFTLPVYSLAAQLASIVSAAELLTHSVALVTVAVSHVDQRPLKGKRDQAALLGAWDTLQACTLPNLIVLLPRPPHAGTRESFFIVACVNQSSAEVLAGQLGGQLARSRSLQDSGLVPEVSFVLLGTRSASKEPRSKDLVNSEVVQRIEDLMKDALQKGETLHERTQSPHSG